MEQKQQKYFIGDPVKLKQNPARTGVVVWYDPRPANLKCYSVHFYGGKVEDRTDRGLYTVDEIETNHNKKETVKII